MSGTAPADHPEFQQQEGQDLSSWEVLEALATTTHTVHRYISAWLARHQPLPADPSRLSGPRMHVLNTVAEAGSLRMRDLADQLGVAARTVTDLVDGLERDGLLIRRPDPTDRRATLVELSKGMRTHWEEIRALQQQCSDEITARLSIEERRQLFDLLHRLKMGAEREATPP